LLKSGEKFLFLEQYIVEKQNLIITFKVRPEQRALFQDILANDASLEFLSELSTDQRQKTLKSAVLLLSWNFPNEITESEYEYLQNVKFIQLMSAGADHMPFTKLPLNITVASNTGAYAEPMAEHVMGMTLALAKRLCIENHNLRNGKWNQMTPNRMLSGMTAGILGFGGIGKSSARLMRSFGMHIHAINTSGKTDEQVDFMGTLDDLEKVLRESDVVLVALPLNRTTHELIGKKQLDWMKPDAILINVSRGAILDESALYQHVKEHPDFGLGIDAWWTEPFRNGRFEMEFPFLDLPNVLGSPHNSAIVPDSLLKGAGQAVENLRHYIRGEKVKGIIRREDYIE
jgi:phosphoglycerate dehydrogenase-like enzyme